MTGLLRDPSLTALTLIVIDFEGLTPAGRPAEPTEVAALALRPEHGHLVEVGRFESLIRPPADVQVTARDVAQTGITTAMLSRADPAAAVLARLDTYLTAPPYRLVAHHAPTEAGMIARQAAHCPRLAAVPLLDTIRLAKALLPGLGSYWTTSWPTTRSPGRSTGTGRCPTSRPPPNSWSACSQRGAPPAGGTPCWTWTWPPDCRPSTPLPTAPSRSSTPSSDHQRLHPRHPART